MLLARVALPSFTAYVFAFGHIDSIFISSVLHRETPCLWYCWIFGRSSVTWIYSLALHSWKLLVASQLGNKCIKTTDNSSAWGVVTLLGRQPRIQSRGYKSVRRVPKLFQIDAFVLFSRPPHLHPQSILVFLINLHNIQATSTSALTLNLGMGK